MADDYEELTGDALRDFIDAPPKARCSACGRKTWEAANIGQPCLMPQPSGDSCPGVFEEERPGKIYSFTVCLICEQEIDESNEHRHQGPTHDVQDVRLVPVSSIRARLTDKGAEAMARKEYELHQGEMGYETGWEEESQGHRNIWLDAARERILLALATAFPELPDA